MGAITSTPANLAAVATANDGAGDTYTLYFVLGSGGYYISKTTPDNVTAYFPLGNAANPVNYLEVTPSGDVYFMIGNSGQVFRLNPDGSTTLAAAPVDSKPVDTPSGFSVDANDNITIEVQLVDSEGGETNPEIFAATCQVPYFSGPITMPLGGESGFPPGTNPVTPFPPLTPYYSVAFSPNPTVNLSAGSATSILPIAYQWYYNGMPIDCATLSTYDGPYLGNGTYALTAATAGGTVTASATLELTIDGNPAAAAPTFISSPNGVSIGLGETATLSASAEAILPIAFQWYFNGTAIAGANNVTPSSTTYGLYGTSYLANQPGVYTVVATTVGNGGGSLTSQSATLAVTSSSGAAVGQIPTIMTQPQSVSFNYGTIPMLSVVAIASLPISYQWQLDGTNIPGATQTSYSTGVPGTYTVVATTAAGFVTSSPVVVALASRPINISARVSIGTSADVGIAGFVVSSYSGASKQLLIRAVGPTLAEFNVPGVLAQPVLTVYDGSGNFVASDTGWNNSPSIAAAASAAGAFALSPGSADSAVLLNLAPGNYTAQVAGLNGTTGVALIEVYEIAADSGHLINISTRASVGTGPNILIGGFVIGGTQSSQLLIRGVGPGLTQFGVSGALAEPVLSVYDSAGNLVAVNDGWSNGSSEDAVAVANAASASGAFPLIPGSADSAVFVTLAPGQYTAQVTGVDGSTGVALVEIYQVP